MKKQSRKEQIQEIHALALAKQAGMNICHVCLEELPSDTMHLHRKLPKTTKGNAGSSS